MTTDPLGSFRDDLVQAVGGEARRRRKRLAVVAGAATALAIAAGAVAVSASGRDGQRVTADGPTTTTIPAFECPITRATEPGFTAPDGWPAHPPDGVWYGTADLWTELPADGGSPTPRKSVWWSVHFDVHADETPDITVTWRRLDEPESEPVTAESPGTNVFIPSEGWFMMNGIDPPKLGCWEVTASYQGHELSYVYEIRPHITTWEKPDEMSEQALVGGQVAYDEPANCFFLEREEQRYPVVWPYGTSVSKDGRRITLADGTAIVVGDRVEGAGGYHGHEVQSRFNIDPGCLVDAPEIAVFGASVSIEVTP